MAKAIQRPRRSTLASMSIRDKGKKFFIFIEKKKGSLVPRGGFLSSHPIKVLASGLDFVGIPFIPGIRDRDFLFGA